MAELLTVRARILEAAASILVTAPEPSTGVLFNRCFRSTLDGITGLHLPACGLEEGPEDTQERTWPCKEHNLTLFLHFKWQPKDDVEPSVLYNHYLGRVKSLFYSQRNLGGLAKNLVDLGNNPEIEGTGDPEPGGVWFFAITYETHCDDPYRQPFD